jgi:glycosyltransferase involved in cell wall biosynthesis
MGSGSRSPVLFLGHGGAIDGQQRQVLYLAAGLVRQGRPVVSAASEAGELHAALEQLGVESVATRMSSWRSPSRVISRYRDARWLTGFARARGVGIVHAHDVWRAGYARFIAQRIGVPHVVHIRGPLSAKDIEKHKLGAADALIAIAQRYVDDLVAAGIDATRIALIDDAVDLAMFSSAPADAGLLGRQLGIVRGPIVGLVGRITPFKRICEFLEIAARLAKDGASAPCFVVMGDWEERDYRREVERTLTRLALQERVHFLGRCAQQAMPSMLAGLDVLVTLSGGSVMFEAMAMGKPVLSLRADGRHSCHTIHDRTAWCIDSEEASAGAAALARLLDDDALRRRLGEAARAWVQQRLTTESMVDKVQTLYARIA